MGIVGAGEHILICPKASSRVGNPFLLRRTVVLDFDKGIGKNIFVEAILFRSGARHFLVFREAVPELLCGLDEVPIVSVSVYKTLSPLYQIVAPAVAVRWTGLPCIPPGGAAPVENSASGTSTAKPPTLIRAACTATRPYLVPAGGAKRPRYQIDSGAPLPTSPCTTPAATASACISYLSPTRPTPPDNWTPPRCWITCAASCAAVCKSALPATLY